MRIVGVLVSPAVVLATVEGATEGGVGGCLGDVTVNVMLFSVTDGVVTSGVVTSGVVDATVVSECLR